MVGREAVGTTGGPAGGRRRAGRRRAVVALGAVVLVAAAVTAWALRPDGEGGRDEVATTAPQARTVLVDPPDGPWAVAATDPGTGRMAWGLPVGDGFEILSGLALADGVLYGQYGSCARDVEVERTAGVVAVRAEDGAELWRTPPLFGGETALDGNFRSARDGVYVALNDGEDLVERPTVLVGVDVRSGTEVWRRELTPRGARAGAALLDGSVLVVASPTLGRGTSLWALDRTTGAILWKQELPDEGVHGFAVVGDRLVLSSSQEQVSLSGAQVRSLELADGEPGWTAPDVRFEHPGFAADGVLLATTLATERDASVGLDLATGAERWRRVGWEERRGLYRDVVERLQGPDAISEAIDLVTGATRWRAPAGLRITVARPAGALFSDARDMAGTGAGTGLVLLAPDGTEVGTVAQLPGEHAQVDVAPAVDGAHRVYFGRGCAGRS